MAALTEQLEWPNGEGYTPCSSEYRQLVEERETLFCLGTGLTGVSTVAKERQSLENLSPDDYNRYNNIEDQLATMRATGHLGTPFRF